MKCTGHCIHDTILSNHRSVVTVPVPSFKLQHLSVGRPQIVEKHNSKWLVGYNETPPSSQRDTSNVTAKATPAAQTLAKVPLAHITSSPLLL